MISDLRIQHRDSVIPSLSEGIQKQSGSRIGVRDDKNGIQKYNIRLNNKINFNKILNENR